MDPITDTEWINRCQERLLFRDPEMSEFVAEEIAEELAAQSMWRARQPEEAADRTFEPGPWSAA